MFANGPGDLGSIPGRVIPKTQKMVLDASLLSTQHYKVRIKGKVEQSRKGVAPSPTHWCSSYRKGSLRVTLDYGRQLTYSPSGCCSCFSMKVWVSLVWPMHNRDIMSSSWEQAFCLDMAQGCRNGVPNEIQTHSWRFASLVCKPFMTIWSIHWGWNLMQSIIHFFFIEENLIFLL